MKSRMAALSGDFCGGEFCLSGEQGSLYSLTKRGAEMSNIVPRNVPTSPVSLEDYTAMDMAARRKVWLEISDITEQEFEAHMAEEKAREAAVPKVGGMAPDFVADVLDRQRKRTGETVRLSDLRGQPVGIIFGSYT
jgi:hypothetical protein